MANQAESAPVRGLLLIGIAVLIGLLFLSKGFDNGGVDIDTAGLPSSETTIPSGVGSGTSDTTGDIIAGTGGETPTTAVPPASLLVYVANGSGVAGAAGVATTELQTAGYSAAIPPEGSAPTTPTTIVYYYQDATTNYQGDAQAVAAVLGAQPTAVQPLPADPGFDIKNATVVVWLGPDIAQAA